MSNQRQSIESQAKSLDQAIAECVRIAETNAKFDENELLSRFPQWESELREFFSDWQRMERLTCGIAEERRSQRVFRPLGSETRRFGDYVLLDEIGYGGMGAIYKARQISLDRIVALKMILDPRQDRDRFRVEAEASASLHHPNIVSIYEVGEHEGHPYFSMQYIDGGSLSDVMDSSRLQPKEVARLVATIAHAAHFAHQRGILHRDLKPGNILLSSDGCPFITDFGLAKQFQSDSNITQTGAILGTPGYMAPEQAMGEIKNLTVATDVHGLGAIMYAALSGRAPFEGQTTLETIRLVMDKPATPLREHRTDVPRDLQTICHKCLEKDPSSRYGFRRRTRGGPRTISPA